MKALELGQRIRDLRQAKGLSQLQFANLCDMNESHIALLEAGTRYPRYDTLVKLAKGLGMQPSELIADAMPVLVEQDVFVNQVKAETESLHPAHKEHLLKIIREYVKAVSVPTQEK